MIFTKKKVRNLPNILDKNDIEKENYLEIKENNQEKEIMDVKSKSKQDAICYLDASKSQISV